MSDKDDKIELLINEFKLVSPTPQQSLKWYLAVQKKINRRRNFYRTSISLAAGIVIGIIIGGFLLKMNTAGEQKDDFSATFAMVSVNNLTGN